MHTLLLQPEINGGLAQLARASALHAEGQRFESVILHTKGHRNIRTGNEFKKIYDILYKQSNKRIK